MILLENPLSQKIQMKLTSGIKNIKYLLNKYPISLIEIMQLLYLTLEEV